MALILLRLLACGDRGVPVVDREVEAGCGTCVFQMEGMAGCFWAVRFTGEDPTGVPGRAYPVGGEHPPDDMAAAHQPGGMCTMSRRAIVSGSIREDGRFLATGFELLPEDGTELPAAPHAH